LIGKWRGRSGTRSEENWREAYLAGVAVYLVTYLFAVNLLRDRLSFGPAAIVLFLLLFGIWIFWLIVLYLHSLVVKAIWACGLCRDLSRNRVQSVLMGILTTAFAAQLVISGSWVRWVGALWLMAVALNLSAALLLALLYDERS
jgi:hypothetical protein